MRFKEGKLYKNLFMDYGGMYQEVIFKIVDSDYDHHKAYWEYQIELISPKYFTNPKGETSNRFWVRTPFMASSEELPDNHPATLLYGKK